MSDKTQTQPLQPVPIVERVASLNPGDMDDLCDATDSAIEDGGGFGWTRLPSRDLLERYWRGVMTMPARTLFVARLDGVICGTAILILPSRNNEAQSFAGTMASVFVAPWARGHGLARMLVEAVEASAKEEGLDVVNLDVRETQRIAINLYERMGYVLFGTHPAYARIDGKTVSGRYYYKILN